jgi:tetrahydromethanopterin S-methyltransferase subunit F
MKSTMQTSNQLRISNLEKAHELMSNRLSGLVLGFIGAIITGVGTWFSQNLLNR